EAASPAGRARTSASSSAVQTRVPGTNVPRARCVALILPRASSVWWVPRWASATASPTCGGRGRPRLAAAILARRWGSRAFAPARRWVRRAPGGGRGPLGLEEQLAAATQDGYERQGGKEARDWPHKKRQ